MTPITDGQAVLLFMILLAAVCVAFGWGYNMGREDGTTIVFTPEDDEEPPCES